MKKTMKVKALTMMVVGLALAGLTGCGSSGGGGGSSSQASTYAVVGGITNPVALYPNLFTGSYSRDFSIQGALYGQSGSTGPGSPVAIQGTLTITDTLYCSYPGTYTVSTTQPGTMNGAVISAMQLQATGSGGTILMQVSGGNVESASGEIALTMNLYVNGQYCGVLITD